jgi:hypothetical protein
MFRRKPAQQRIAPGLALTVCVALLGMALRHRDWRLGDGFLRESYDLLHSRTGPRSEAVANSLIAVVYAGRKTVPLSGR